jgi:DNA repair protein RecN (Recombination protein N)
MLQTLRVKHLAIVENVRVDFEHGLNVITGETGAGKSILIGALGLVLGERADRALIRAGEEQCGVEATFRLSDSSAVDAVLEELGMEPCEDGALVIRRIVSGTGAGKILVNDAAATVQALKRIGDLLVDIHGPYDHQSLLNGDFQLDLLDSFGHLWKVRAEYEDRYREMLDLRAKRRALEGDDRDVGQQIEMLSYQVKEIQEAQLEGTTEDDVRQEHAKVANAQRLLELAQGIRNALTEEETCVFSATASVQSLLAELAKIAPEAEPWAEEARSIAVRAQELSRSVGEMAQTVEGDPGRLQWLEDRLALIHRLKRKYGEGIPEILASLAAARERLRDLETRGEQLAEVDRQLEKVRPRLDKVGGDLRQQRAAAAKKLAQAVTRELRDLGFPHGAFDVALLESEPLPTGLDKVDFGFAPNAGEPMRPLRAIASGGEMARVMLATKAVLASHDRIPVLVFDEIDANVGGEMGHAIGAKLAAVASSHQVLCITHLPQVAVHGGTHFRVAKRVQDGRTLTEIGRADGEERVEEVARMLGGRDSTSVALRHARELLQRT